MKEIVKTQLAQQLVVEKNKKTKFGKKRDLFCN